MESSLTRYGPYGMREQSDLILHSRSLTKLYLSDIYPSRHTVLSMFTHLLIQNCIPAAGYAEAVKANRIGSETARTRRHDIKHISQGAAEFLLVTLITICILLLHGHNSLPFW